MQPWHWFLDILLAHLGPVAFLVLMGIRRSAFLGWVALIVLVSHNYFAHRELRWIYPIMPLVITLAALGVMEVAPALNRRRRSPLPSRTIVVSGLALCVLSSGLLTSQCHWSRNSGSLVAFDQLSRDSTLCGVGIYRIEWYSLGAYSHLHQNVPIILPRQASELEDQSPSFNAVVTHGSLTDPKGGFELAGCWNGVCLYRNPGPWAPPQGSNEINWAVWLTGS